VGNVVAGLVATFLVSVLATLYPARLATRVQPVVAMQGKE
jgi:ABC-type lipoprotein release transport system permease subunit